MTDALDRYRQLHEKAHQLNVSVNDLHDRERKAHAALDIVEAELKRETTAARVRPLRFDGRGRPGKRREPDPEYVAAAEAARAEHQRLAGVAKETSARWKQLGALVIRCQKELVELGIEFDQNNLPTKRLFPTTARRDAPESKGELDGYKPPREF